MSLLHCYALHEAKELEKTSGAVSLCSFCEQVAELSDETNIEVVDLAGLSSESIEYLHASPDRPPVSESACVLDRPLPLWHCVLRCETVMLWIERLIVESEKQKLFDVAPPVLSRAFQELSDGISAQGLSQVCAGSSCAFCPPSCDSGGQ